MALFGRKPVTHTNAPRHWPKVELDQFDNPGINLIMIGGPSDVVIESRILPESAEEPKPVAAPRMCKDLDVAPVPQIGDLTRSQDRL